VTPSIARRADSRTPDVRLPLTDASPAAVEVALAAMAR